MGAASLRMYTPATLCGCRGCNGSAPPHLDTWASARGAPCCPPPCRPGPLLQPQGAPGRGGRRHRAAGGSLRPPCAPVPRRWLHRRREGRQQRQKKQGGGGPRAPPERRPAPPAPARRPRGRAYRADGGPRSSLSPTQRAHRSAPVRLVGSRKCPLLFLSLKVSRRRDPRPGTYPAHRPVD